MSPNSRKILASRMLRHGAAWAALVTPLLTAAQTGLAPALPSPDAAASSSSVSAAPSTRRRPTPQVIGPSDASRSLDLNNPQPEGKVTPQLRIPLGKRGDTPVFQRRRPDATPAAGGNAVNDGAARCDAQIEPQQRAKCRDQLARDVAK